MLGPWLAYPLILLALAYGAGELVQLAAGRTLRGAIRVPCGLALVIAVMDLCTRTTSTATLAVPAVVLIGVAGLALSARRAWRTPAGRWFAGLRPGPGAVAALAAFAVYAAPVVLSGHATWLGYNVLNDSSIWLAIVDQALAHGRTISDLQPSTYSAILSGYLTVGYPIGAFLPLGIGHALLGQDLAWLMDPWMAFTASMLALAIYGLARRAAPQAQPWLAAIIAALSASSTLLYGYYLWGGIKELVGAVLVATAAVAAPLPLEGERRARAAIPLGIVVWALIAALSPGGLIWIGPGGLLAVALFALRRRLPSWRAGHAAAEAQTAAGTVAGDDAQGGTPTPASAATATTGRPGRTARAERGAPATRTPAKRTPKSSGKRARGTAPAARSRRSAAPSRAAADPGRAGAFVAARRWVLGLPRAWLVAATGLLVVALGLLLLLRHGGFVQTYQGVLTSGSQLGTLVKPLNPLQVAGIWPSGDFRYAPSAPGLTYVLIAIVIVSAAVAFVLELRAGRWEPVLYLLFALAGAVLAVLLAAPWIAAKALASASPALPFAALLGAALLARRHAAAAAILIVVVGGGIVWGDALGYHDARLAPRALFASLASVAPSIAGQGPTLMTEYSVYGGRHFLRDAQTDVPGDQRGEPDPLVNGHLPAGTTYADLDAYELAATGQYPTIVLQRSPVTTRPSEPYTLLLRDRYWEVWQRPQIVTPRVLSYLPVGDITSYLRPAGVPTCSHVLALARVPGVTQLAAAPAVNPIVVNASLGSHPARWGQGALLAMNGSGTARIPVSVPSTGRYGLWLARTIQNPTSLSVDGHTLATVSDEAEESGQFVSFGDATLSAGRHVVTLHHSSNLLAPGSGQTDLVGPLVLASDAPAGLITVPVSAAASLCGRSVSWIDALGP